jgi:hypothetical protein
MDIHAFCENHISGMYGLYLIWGLG